MKKIINDYIKAEKRTLTNLDVDTIEALIDELLSCLDNDKTIYTFGNGGSGSTASHLKGDFSKAIFKKTNKRFKIECLNDNIPTMMAVSNDISYDEIFKYQLIDKVNKNDVIIAISGSGNSKNIIKACTYAKSKGAKIISLTGFDGGKLKQISDIHLIIEHLIISYLYTTLEMRDYNE